MKDEGTAAATTAEETLVSTAEFATYKAEIERLLIERETRAVPIWLNLINALRHEGWAGAHAQAAIRALVWKLVSPGGMALAGMTLASLVTLALAWQSNRLLKEQNKLIETQNVLQESSRRAGLAVELTEVLNRVSDRGKDTSETPPPTGAIGCSQEKYGYKFAVAPTFGSKPVELPPALAGRVVALSKSFRPYRYLDVDRFEFGSDRQTGLSELSSPERAQLLLALASSNVSIELVSAAGAEFSRAPLMNAALSGLSLRGVAVPQSDWNGALLVLTDLTQADLRWSKLVEVNATCAVFDKANLASANLSDGQFKGATFRNAVLTDANISLARLDDADFSGADLRGAFECDAGRRVLLDTAEKFMTLAGKSIKVDADTKFGGTVVESSRAPCH